MELRTTEGKIYYQNSNLKITQWERPVTVAPAGQRTIAGLAGEAPTQLDTATYNSKCCPSAAGAAGERQK